MYDDIPDVLSRITYEWDKVIKEVNVWATEKKWHELKGVNISWKKMSRYQNCQHFDPSEYFDFKTYPPLQIFIHFSKIENMGLSFDLMDKSKVIFLNFLSS